MVHRDFSLKAVAVYAVAFAASVPAASAQEQQAASLPNGASSLQETYQDWQLACRMQDNARVCTVTQDQTQKNGQRLLAVELRVGQKGGVAGTLLLPFGILFDPGVTLQIDDQPPLLQQRLRTCLPAGCLAVFSIDRSVLGKLRGGEVLKLNVTTDAETPLTFPVSLHGLTAALDRMVALSAR
ncbi:invasion associated locus B family protein [Mesorhizobium loti]|uniref:Invasion associated locus B family protein n=1 Tax=Mesorhizobium loti R88b TaxID=935548 RepID=A0A6M7WQD6_RHILI|nr:invasion associated locus B family protein [Mesorhizobium loti]QKD02164.1 invasion associated locus B family protein [Mesorhizobium loti R88b]